ncbi:MAG: RtcB family protein [Treponema sp.]|nr:RtcB family protein [Treponema sp.]
MGITIIGKNTSAIVYSDSIEDYAITQIKNICDNDVSINSKIRIMSDIHPGFVAPIGLTMTIGNRILPNLVGIDIGCGMTLAKVIKHRGIEYKQLDSIIRNKIPSGFQIRKSQHRFVNQFDFDELICHKHIQKENAALSLGTLGSGNHFIEIDKDEDKNIYIVIHSGSRHLGKEITDYYINLGRKKLKQQNKEVAYELTYLEDSLMQDYLHDIKLVQDFAKLNRLAMLDEIVKGMNWKTETSYSCVHNYIDFSKEYSRPILRKGAISAKEGEKVIIPINMKDGVILGKGKGNADWNYSAPHGSGRIMKREDVKKSFTVSSFKSAMKGIYSSCISAATLDEAPFAYRPIEEIKKLIEPTVQIEKVIKPVYNFKAGGEA